MGIAINAAHELGHRRTKLERRLSKLALAQTGYGHFFVEHNRGHHVRVATPEEALAAVVGYSTFNDVTSRRAQKQTTQWIIGKNGDKSGPLGPLVPAGEVGAIADGLAIETRVNGEVVG